VGDGLSDVSDLSRLGRLALQIGFAAILGGVVGAEREWVGKAAGLRTHMLVSLGAALFVLVPIESGSGPGDVTRVIQGVAAGVGFVGAGTILKHTERDEVTGLTTAATIWVTGGIGIAVGAGQTWLAVLCAAAAVTVLYVLTGLDRWLQRRRPPG
jgi:putative Mg2+ transporter-C (MgtC) family protein